MTAALDSEGMTPETVPPSIPGKPETLADLGRPESDMSRMLTMRRGLTSQQAGETNTALDARTNGITDRVQGDLESGTGLKRINSTDYIAELGKSAQQVAKPVYDEAYAQGVVNDPAVSAALSDYNIQKDVLPKVAELGRRADRPEIVQMAKDAMRPQQAEAAPVAGPSDLEQSATFSPPAPEAKPPTLPTVEFLDFVKRGLDDVLHLGRRGAATGMGSGLGPNEEREIIGARGRFLQAVDEAAPKYAEARQSFSDVKSLQNMAERGTDLWKPTTNVRNEAALLQQSTPDEVQAYRRTGIDALLTNVSNSPADNAILRQADKPAVQQKIALLFDDPAKAADFTKKLAAEARMAATKGPGGANESDLLGSSPPDIPAFRHRLYQRVINSATPASPAFGADAAAERTRLLTAGMGNGTSRSSALEDLGNYVLGRKKNFAAASGARAGLAAQRFGQGQP